MAHDPVHRLSRRGLLLASALPGLAGEATAQTAARTSVRGGTMVMIVNPEPATLATYAVSAGNIPMITTQVYEGLLTYDWNIKPAPALAKAGKSAAMARPSSSSCSPAWSSTMARPSPAPTWPIPTWRSRRNSTRTAR
jgi:hypothetical protein